MVIEQDPIQVAVINSNGVDQVALIFGDETLVFEPTVAHHIANNLQRCVERSERRGLTQWRRVSETVMPFVASQVDEREDESYKTDVVVLAVGRDEFDDVMLDVEGERYLLNPHTVENLVASLRKWNGKGRKHR